MAISEKFSKDDILKAIEYIYKNGIPEHNQSTKYDLVDQSGNKYPPKYIIAIATHIKTDKEISTEVFTTQEAVRVLQNLGFSIEEKQEKFELIITANEVTSTDDQFTMDNIELGNNYKPLDSYFKSASGEEIRRKYSKNERKNSNQTMPRIAFQVFEKQIVALTVDEKENFPVCQYTTTSEIIRGIFPSVDKFREHRNTIEFLQYSYDNGKQFVIYCWNIFSTIIFIKECLKRFGKQGDKFVLIYREKDKKEAAQPENEEAVVEEQSQELNRHLNPYSASLIESKNVIFRGAPGTGKTYLAKEIAADIISYGHFDDYELLTVEQKKQVEFVQFHPSYDYSDFVEGLRPKTNDDGSMGFELKDGVFKQFVSRAKKNSDDSKKSQEVIEKEASVQETMLDFFSNIELGIDKLETARKTKFYITSVDDKHINISIPENNVSSKLSLNIEELKEMLESDQKFDQVKDVTHFFGKVNATQNYSYDLAIFNAIKAKKPSISKLASKPEKLKPYIFIIDEINRGEISKILGELFFSIDPGYRGQSGEVSTQYANLHDNPDEKFYIPENVYIIGTMNDIDRSVDSFDFAMRRRFRFMEIKAEDRLGMLDKLDEYKKGIKDEAKRRMKALNDEILKVDELNENYHIGPAYFMKLVDVTFDQLWTDYLQPLLHEYIRGMNDEIDIMEKFAKAYGYAIVKAGDSDDATQD